METPIHAGELLTRGDPSWQDILRVLGPRKFHERWLDEALTIYRRSRISETMREEPNPNVIAWLDSQPAASIWTTSITVFGIYFGIELPAAGKRRRLLTSFFEQALWEDFNNRILTFDIVAAKEAAAISSLLKKSGRSTDMRDVEIAAIVKVCKGTLPHAISKTSRQQEFDSSIRGMPQVDEFFVRSQRRFR